jgi:hypothetical protein
MGGFFFIGFNRRLTILPAFSWAGDLPHQALL